MDLEILYFYTQNFKLSEFENTYLKILTYPSENLIKIQKSAESILGSPVYLPFLRQCPECHQVTDTCGTFVHVQYKHQHTSVTHMF